MTPLVPLYSSGNGSSGPGSGSPARPDGLRVSKNCPRAANSSAADSWSKSSAPVGSAGNAPAETGPDPERSGGSARMISARRAITRARFCSGVSASGDGDGSSVGSTGGCGSDSGTWHGSVGAVLVDSYRFLPRSFVPMYQGTTPAPGDAGPVWAPFEKRLAGSRIALVTSAGLYLAGEQAPFDAEREKAEPTWGDPTHRVLPADSGGPALGMMHLHVNNDDVLADPEIALPLGGLATLVAEGQVGSVAPGTSRSWATSRRDWRSGDEKRPRPSSISCGIRRPTG